MATDSVVPRDCHLRAQGNPTRDQLRNDLRVIDTYVDESHLIRRLEQCKLCGQLYFYEFYEEIDWLEGNDPQYRIWIPVEDADSARELNKLGPTQLLGYTGIRSDFPSTADIPTGPRWVDRPS